MDSLKFYHEDLKKIFGENTKYIELNDIRFLDKKAQIKVVSQIEGDLEEFNTITLESYLEMLDKYYNADKLKYKNEVSIKTLNFSTMIRNALSRAGISYVCQLENLTEKQLKKVENIGEKAMSDIKMELKRIGKKLKEESYCPHVKEIKQYFDKNNKKIKDCNYLICEEKVCQALRCDDGTLLYEILILKKNGKLDLKDDFYYPDAYEFEEIEIIDKEKAIELLTKI